MKACVIFNPTARGDKAARLRTRLHELATRCQLKPTSGPGTAGALAAQAVDEGLDLIIAAGGDGTVNEVLNGMAQAKDGLARARLAVIPLGTANVFAKEIRMPSSFTRSWEIIQRENEMSIDVGQAQYISQGDRVQRLFLQLAGAGIDSRAVDLVVWKQKRRWGKLAYVIAACRSLMTAPARIDVVSEEEHQVAEQVLIGNGKFYGGRFLLFPRAALRDGLLDVTVFPSVAWRGLIRGGWGLLSNQLYTSGGLRHLHTRQVSLSSKERVPFQLDGDNVGELPVTFSLYAQRVRIITP